MAGWELHRAVRLSFERPTVAVLAVLFLLAGCASGEAPTPRSPPPPAIGRGQSVSAAAWADATPLILAALDGNGDGALSAEEVEIAQGSGLIDGLSPIPEIELMGLLAYGDRNGDGRIDAQELSFFRTRVFVLLDRNRDGRLDVQELDVADIVVGYAYRPRLPY
jgi:hypothetical protein